MNQAAPDLSQDQKRLWLRLIRTPSIGPSTFRQLLNRFGSAQNALDALPEILARGRKKASVPDWSVIDKELEALEKGGGELVAIRTANYPNLINHISDAPPLLSVWGKIENTKPTIAIVGARNASAAGQRMTKLLAQELGEAGYLVISGLARGVDAAAHEAALKSGTIAFIAGGLDKIYPEENKPLARQIVDNGGAIVTEAAMGAVARAKDFPRRNRLVSGATQGTIVIEAAKRSGSLITARVALEQDREVFAVPGFPLDPRSAGTNHLIQQGAHLVTSAQDVLDQLQIPMLKMQNALQEPTADEPFNYPQNHYEPTQSERDKLRQALSHTPTSIDEIAQSAKIDIPKVHALLLELEILGEIERSTGNLVALT